MFQLFRGRVQKLVRCNFNECLFCDFSSDPSSKSKLSENDTEKASESLKPLENKQKQNVTKEDLIWRTPWHRKNITYYETLRTFYSEENNANLLKWIQQPIDLSPSSIKNWFNRVNEHRVRVSQLYNPDRHSILGPELACAHFVVSRGGAVKFHNEDKWIKAVDGDYALPGRYKSGMYLQAIDCTDMELRYEGLDNLRELQNVEWLSLNGCDYVDDFCMDVISNIFSHSLLYLDLRNCFYITERGLGALYKMNHLKILYLDDMFKDTRYEMTCLLLEDINPELDIKSDVVTFEIK